MKIGLMVIPDEGEHFGHAWDEYDEKRGYHLKDLRRLLRKAQKNLTDKNKYYQSLSTCLNAAAGLHTVITECKEEK